MTTSTKQPHITLRFLPSTMTVAAICLGLTAVKYAQDKSLAIESRATWAMALLVLAAVLDALDGRIARVLNATSRMGEEIDSLADAVNFGVVPAFIVYAILLEGLPRVGWLVVLLYAVCIVLRLARFNALLDVDQPAYAKNYFVGMPAPAGAVGAIGPIAAKLQFGDGWWTWDWVVSLWLVGVSLLVVSRIPMRKVHTFSVPPNMVAPMLALLAMGVASAFIFPYLTILVIIAAYVIHIPFAVRSKRFLAKHPEAWDPKAKRRRAQRRAIRRSQEPHRRSVARLGLRRPQR
ncbi:MAG TPA: CDP-diacylglycerol--serine O-phosphatidyltransferase [Mycobacterium sp.]|nr:CDP-diacylglycerol--serine O-phosphatidyltransferase [Mycobacterium sp.]